jgi:hypothetical protein
MKQAADLSPSPSCSTGFEKNVGLQHEASGSKHVPFLPLPNRVHLESCVQPSQ